MASKKLGLDISIDMLIMKLLQDCEGVGEGEKTSALY